jgi:hypothetical protein
MKKRDELIHKEKLDVAAAAAGNHITVCPNLFWFAAPLLIIEYIWPHP